MHRLWQYGRCCLLLSVLLGACAHAARHDDNRMLRGGGRSASASQRALQIGKQTMFNTCYDPSVALVVDKTSYPFCRVMEHDRVVLYWNHDGGQGKTVTTLDFVVVANTTNDWVAIGLSEESGGMKGMDVSMLRKTQEGQWDLEDRWATEYAMPVLDTHQDKLLKFVDAHPEQSSVVFGFSMPINNAVATVDCKKDPQDAVLDLERWVFVMWAMGDNAGGQPQYHGDDNGMVHLPLFTSPEEYWQQDAPMPVPANSTTTTVRLPMVEMPATDTTYFCMYVETPQDRKYHIYNTKLLGDVDLLEKYVHHMFVYNVVIDELERPPGEVYECYNDSPQSRGIPMLMSSHGSVTSPSDRTLDEVDAAFPLGKGYAKYWVLEVHLNNENSDAGVHLNPGFEITYSPVLRKQDLGVFAVGSIPTIPRLGTRTSLVIPPHMETYHHLDYCPSVCTRNLVPQEGVHIIFSRIHMHYLGRGGEIQIVRSSKKADGSNTTVAEPVRTTYMEHWDFDHQEGQTYEQPGIPFYPGDRVITRCSYNSMDRTNTTTWGDSAHDEMCIGYLFVYPAFDHTVCMDLRGSGDPALDYWRSRGFPLDMAFCTSLTQYSNATRANSADEWDTYVGQHGLALNIPADELKTKQQWDSPLLRAACPANESDVSSPSHH